MNEDTTQLWKYQTRHARCQCRWPWRPSVPAVLLRQLWLWWQLTNDCNYRFKHCTLYCLVKIFQFLKEIGDTFFFLSQTQFPAKTWITKQCTSGDWPTKCLQPGKLTIIMIQWWYHYRKSITERGSAERVHTYEQENYLHPLSKESGGLGDDHWDVWAVAMRSLVLF